MRLPASKLKIPQIGWNKLIYKNDSSLFEGFDEGEYVYFVHSYHAKVNDSTLVTASVEYGGDITASVCKDNIHALQFHPEKSAEVGLKILYNFKEFNL